MPQDEHSHLSLRDELSPEEYKRYRKLTRTGRLGRNATLEKQRKLADGPESG